MFSTLFNHILSIWSILTFTLVNMFSKSSAADLWFKRLVLCHHYVKSDLKSIGSILSVLSLTLQHLRIHAYSDQLFWNKNYERHGWSCFDFYNFIELLKSFSRIYFEKLFLVWHSTRFHFLFFYTLCPNMYKTKTSSHNKLWAISSFATMFSTFPTFYKFVYWYFPYICLEVSKCRYDVSGKGLK